MTKDIKEFDVLSAEIAALVEPTKLIKVIDFNTCNYAIEAGKSVKAFLKKIETKRKELVEPLNEQVKAINSYAKQISSPIESAESHIKKEVIAFENEQQQIRYDLRIKLETEQRAKEIALQAELSEAVSKPVDCDDIFGIQELEVEKIKVDQKILHHEIKAKEYDIKQIGVRNARKIWKCELIDIKKVPDQFRIVTLNEKAVLAVAREGQVEIPGVKVWQETTIAFGANTYIPRESLD